MDDARRHEDDDLRDANQLQSKEPTAHLSRKPYQVPTSRLIKISQMDRMIEISLTGSDDHLPRAEESQSDLSAGWTVRKVLPIAFKKGVTLKDEIIPLLVKYLEMSDLVSCLTVSCLFFKAAIPRLYSHIALSQLSGKSLKSLVGTLQNSLVKPNGSRVTLVDYIALVSSLDIQHIVFEDGSPLQSWFVVRDLLRLCAYNLCSLSLEIADESFLDIPGAYVYLHHDTVFASLRKLTVRSRCFQFPEPLVLELLRSSPHDSLQTISLSRCLLNFSFSGWFLIAERGGLSLETLELTPAIGSNMLGWDQKFFRDGIEHLIKQCPRLKKVQLSGHAIGISDTLLTLFMTLTNLEELYLPCGLSDAHLVALLTGTPWTNLKSLGMTCRCVDGESKEATKKVSCNRFADTVLVAMLEHLLKFVKTPCFEVQLPRFLVNVKTAKTVLTLDWMVQLPRVIKTGDDTLLFKERIVLRVPSNRL